MNLKPLNKKVILKEYIKEATNSLLILSSTLKEKSNKAIVVEAASDVDLDIKASDIVIYDNKEVSKIELENEEYIIVDSSDILAVIK